MSNTHNITNICVYMLYKILIRQLVTEAFHVKSEGGGVGTVLVMFISCGGDVWSVVVVDDGGGVGVCVSVELDHGR